MKDKDKFIPEEILTKLIWKIHRDFPNMTTMKDFLNKIGECENIKFSDST